MSKITLTLIVLLLTGCAFKTEKNVNFAPKLTEVEQQQIVSDTVKKLSEMYPPAKTRLNLQLSDQDTFGAVLVHDLREQGYAIQEQTQDLPNPSSGLPVKYVLDQAGDLYRVTITVGSESITRPYSELNGMLTPAGYWVHKESDHVQ